MAERRQCIPCGRVVKCREERHRIEGSHLSLVRLYCPDCERRIADLYR
jgi:hypothetical protein